MAELTVPMESMGVSDKELFDGAVTDVQEQPTQEAATEQPAQQDRPRDDSGRFVKAELKAEAPAQEQPVAEQAATEQPKADAQDKDGLIPSWRARELREARDTVAKQLEEERLARVQLERQLQQFMAQQNQQQNPPPDIFQDPNAWQQHNDQQFKSQIEMVRFEMSEDFVRDKYGDQKVDDALKWAANNIGPAERVRIQNARSPYREMIKLYDERQTLQQIGGDLNAYRAKLQDEFLNDPAFMQKVAERLRGQAPSANQRPVTQLPPSLNKATGSGNSAEGLTDADMTDRALFSFATAR